MCLAPLGNLRCGVIDLGLEEVSCSTFADVRRYRQLGIPALLSVFANSLREIYVDLL